MDSQSRFFILQLAIGAIYIYIGKSDPQDQTDWSTDYVLHQTHCVTSLRIVLIEYL